MGAGTVGIRADHRERERGVRHRDHAGGADAAGKFECLGGLGARLVEVAAVGVLSRESGERARKIEGPACTTREQHATRVGLHGLHDITGHEPEVLPCSQEVKGQVVVAAVVLRRRFV